MSAISAIYRAPKGDSKVCELFGFTFFDGQPVVIEDTPENAHAIKKLSNNSLFEVSEEGSATHSSGEMPSPHPDPDDYPPEGQQRGGRRSHRG